MKRMTFPYIFLALLAAAPLTLRADDDSVVLPGGAPQQIQLDSTLKVLLSSADVLRAMNQLAVRNAADLGSIAVIPPGPVPTATVYRFTYLHRATPGVAQPRGVAPSIMPANGRSEIGHFDVEVAFGSGMVPHVSRVLAPVFLRF